MSNLQMSTTHKINIADLNDKLNEIIVEKDANKKMKELSHI